MIFLLIVIVLVAGYSIKRFEDKDLIPLYEKAISVRNKEASFEKRVDGALRITNCYPRSCQNPVFSPDSKEVLFTRFINGYNKGPSELVILNLETEKERTIVKADGDSVNVPFGSWIDGKITFASDELGMDEVVVSNDDGSNLRQITTTKIGEGLKIEPVFNPKDTSKIVFEYFIGEYHHIKLVDTNIGKEFYLTHDKKYDDRLPSWSPDGKKILWQRTELGKDDWKIYVADIISGMNPRIENVRRVSGGPDDTDNSWTWDGNILSSRTGGGAVPNIFLLSNGAWIGITTSSREDGAPSMAPDKKWIAFESHTTEDEQSASEIWIIKNLGTLKNEDVAVSDVSNSGNKVSLLYFLTGYEKSGAFASILNTSSEYLVVDAFKAVPNDLFSKKEVNTMKKSHNVVLAYLSIGEAEEYRYYWKPEWKEKPPGWMGKTNPDWEGNIKVKYWDSDWQNIILGYVDKIVGQGFDGAYLDIVDGYEYWADSNNGENEILEQDVAASQMINFIGAIRERARAKNVDFKIFPQNAPELARYDNYLSVIDGMGKETTWYEGYDDINLQGSFTKPIAKEIVKEQLNYLRIIKKAGKVILATDYFAPTQQKEASDFVSKARVEGFYYYPSDTRKLDRISIFLR
ncbi:MAG: MJ1477/TM1410 family putative glycoside hydrolase [Patescibacteria group bacterium]